MSENGTIADRLRVARKLAGISARELDRLAGKAEGHAALIEARPEAEAKTGTVQAYAAALGVSLDWLIAGKEPLPTEAEVKTAVDAARARLAAPPP